MHSREKKEKEEEEADDDEETPTYKRSVNPQANSVDACVKAIIHAFFFWVFFQYNPFPF